MNFIQKLEESWGYSKSLLQVGIDPNPTLFPEEIKNTPDPIFEFCRCIVDVTSPYACSFKLQIAHFSAYGAEIQLEKLCIYIREKYPKFPIILDSKRGDICSTAQKYAFEAFGRYKAHALTVNPYMGLDCIEPYLAWKDCGVIVVCRTSNVGSSSIQCLKLEDGDPLYLHIAKLVLKANKTAQFGLVIGANCITELAAVRDLVGDSLPFLIPGIGVQGNAIDMAVQYGINSYGTGIMVNSSRAIIHASSEKDWKELAAESAFRFREEINAARKLSIRELDF